MEFSSKSASRKGNPRQVMLGDHNWHPYKDSILEQSSEYGLCGLALKSGVPVALVEPADTDKKHKATGRIITEAQFIAY